MKKGETWVANTSWNHFEHENQLYISIYMYKHNYMCIYMYIYIYITVLLRKLRHFDASCQSDIQYGSCHIYVNALRSPILRFESTEVNISCKCLKFLKWSHSMKIPWEMVKQKRKNTNSNNAGEITKKNIIWNCRKKNKQLLMLSLYGFFHVILSSPAEKAQGPGHHWERQLPGSHFRINRDVEKIPYPPEN